MTDWIDARREAYRDTSTFYGCRVRSRPHGITQFLCNGEVVATIRPRPDADAPRDRIAVWVKGCPEVVRYVGTAKGALQNVKRRMFQLRYDGATHFDHVPDLSPRAHLQTVKLTVHLPTHEVLELVSPVVPREGEIIQVKGTARMVTSVRYVFDPGPGSNTDLTEIVVRAS